MRNENQKLRFTDEELGLMKSVFAEGTDLLYLIRKVMFQFDMTKDEEKVLEASLTPALKRLLRKVFLPELDPESPLFQLTHLNVALGADIKGYSPDGAEFFIRAKELEADYLDQQLRVLEGEKVKEEISFANMGNTKGKDAEEAYTNMLAWNWMLSFIDSNILQIRNLAGMKDETVEETKKRLAKNSNK